MWILAHSTVRIDFTNYLNFLRILEHCVCVLTNVLFKIRIFLHNNIAKLKMTSTLAWENTNIGSPLPLRIYGNGYIFQCETHFWLFKSFEDSSSPTVFMVMSVLIVHTTQYNLGSISNYKQSTGWCAIIFSRNETRVERECSNRVMFLYTGTNVNVFLSL